MGIIYVKPFFIFSILIYKILTGGDFMNIINFGSCNIDYVYKLSHFVKPGETIKSDNLNRFPGGKGLNQSIAAARSGLKVYHAGCIGKDGEFLKNVLTESHVDITYLKISDVQTGHAIIQVDDKGENCIILYSGSNYMLDKDYIDYVLREFSSNDIVLLQNEINNVEYIIESAYKKGMAVILNPSPFNNALTKVNLDMVSILMLNEIEGFEFSKETEPTKICNYFKSKYPNLKIVLTLGSEGSIYSDKNETIFCPSFSVPVIDTTSAGDTFTGYFICGMINGMKTYETLKFASAASALAVSKNGASSSIPYKSEVESAIKKLVPNKQCLILPQK